MVLDDETNANVSAHTEHNNVTNSIQKKFLNHVYAWVNAFDELGNTFLEETSGLIRLDTKIMMNNTAAKSVNEAYTGHCSTIN